MKINSSQDVKKKPEILFGRRTAPPYFCTPKMKKGVSGNYPEKLKPVKISVLVRFRSSVGRAIHF
jgi:hypothetical protein